MDEEIKNEQKKLAEKLKNLPRDDMEKRGLAMMCWLQGYDVGFQSACDKKEDKK